MKKLRVALVSIAMAACVAVFGACGGTVKVLSVEKTATDGLVDTYTITYSDGSKFNFTVTNGADGENAEQILPSQAYEDAVANGYTGTYTDFLVQYVTSDTSASVSTALKSSVSVYAEHPVTEIEYYYTQGPFGGGIGSREVKQLALSAGSGIIYKIDGNDVYIVTNYHVVYYKDSDAQDKIGRKLVLYPYGNSDAPEAVTDETGAGVAGEDGYPQYGYGSGIECEYVGGSMIYDIAVLKADIEDFEDAGITAVDLAENVFVGDSAFAIGNPSGNGISVTSGTVSVDSEYIAMTAADDVTNVVYRALRTDTPINSGNSGGGLFNSAGQLIGLVNAKIVSPTVENIAYAIPLSIVRGAADNIIDSAASGATKISKLTLGITVASEDSHAEYEAVSGKAFVTERVVVSAVEASGFAAAAGLREGDIILLVTVDGKSSEILRAFNVDDALFDAREGSTVEITVARDGETYRLSAECGAEHFTSID